jgi:hypothetical protein
MPEHTATVEVVTAINKAGIPCDHTHRFNGRERDLAPYNEGFVEFTFLTNPFHRVLTHATFEKRFGEHPGASELAEKHIQIFRHYVAWHVDQHLRGKEHTMGIPHVKLIASVMGGYSHMDTDLYGRTTQLSEDLPKIFKRLGYTDPVLLEGLRNNTRIEGHCLVTCDSEGIHPGFAKMRADKIQWYDEATAKLVIQLYREDFELYGFSKDPANMWIDVGNRSSFY